MRFNLHKEIFDLCKSVQHLSQDKDDIVELLAYELALIKDIKRHKNLYTFLQWWFHACAIYDSLSAIHQMQHHNNKTTAILYLPFILLFAHLGFKDGKIAQEYKTEYQNQIQQYNELKNLINKSTPNTLHNIATTFRNEIPKGTETEPTPETIKKTIHHILMKYQR